MQVYIKNTPVVKTRTRVNVTQTQSCYFTAADFSGQLDSNCPSLPPF